MTERQGLPRSCVLGRVAAWLLVVLALIALGTFRRYGATWDEEQDRNYGKTLETFYLSGGTDHQAVTDWMRFYGGFYQICAGIGEKVLPFGIYESRHLVIVMFGLLGIVFAYKLGALLGGQAAGLLAGAFLTLTPLYYGHMFNNPKDLPFAAMYLGGVYYAVALRRRWPDVSWALAGKASLAIGLTLAIRIGGIFLFGILGLAVAVACVAEVRNRRGTQGTTDSGLRARHWPRVASIPLISWVIMCLFWPYALVSPFGHPLETVRTFSQYSWSGTMLFAGRLVDSHHLPISYVPTWLAVTLPDFLIFALAIVVLGALLGRPRKLWRLADSDWVPLLVASAGPTLLVVVMKSVLYDGLRHLLFVIPPFAVLLAVAVTALWEEVPRARLRWAIALPIGWGMVLAAADMVSLHPYQSVYFNRLIAGGLPGAAGRFDTDYWGSSLKEAVQWTMRNLQPPNDGRLRIGNPCAAFLTGYYVEQDKRAAAHFVNVGRDEAQKGELDYFITTARDGNDKRFPGRPVVYRVERQGVALAFVVAVMGKGESAATAAPESGALLPPIELLPLSALGPSAGHASCYMVPQAAHVRGYGGAAWRTDLVVSNPQKHPLALVAQFLPTGRDNPSAPVVEATVQAGQVLNVADVLALPRFKAAGNFGALLVYATGGADACGGGTCDFLVLARTFNAVVRSDQWRAAEWMGGVGASAALRAGDKVVFSHVTRSDRSKASVGMASWSAKPVRARFRVFEASGREVEKRDLELPRFGHTHILLESEVSDGRVEVEVAGSDGGGMVVPYLSTVDGTTGLSSQRLPDGLPTHSVAKGWRPPMPEPENPVPGAR